MMILYSNNCPNCKRLKEMLDNAGKDYKLITDTKVMIEKGLDNMPALEINGEMYSYKEAFNMILRGDI